MQYIKLIRPLNLLIIILVQWVLYFALLKTLSIPLALNEFQYVLLIFATVCIAAAGNIINDIFDQDIDRINKPKSVIVGENLSEKAAYNFYFLLTILGVGTGFYLANAIGYPSLSGLFIVISALLYIYASQLKSILLLGNFLISILVAMSLIIVILFDIFPVLDETHNALQIQGARVILMYAAFAFYINLIREIVKDLQDIDGDKNGGRLTLPIAIGRQRTLNIVFVLGIIALVTVLSYTYIVLYSYTEVAFYFVFLIAAPLLFFSIRAWSATTKEDCKVLSNTLKIIMVTGICSLFLYTNLMTP